MTFPPFATLASLAWREGRGARRRLLLSMASITLGVAALVAIDSYARSVSVSIRGQSRSLMGGDVQLTSRYPFPAAVEKLLDSLKRQGIQNTRVTNFPSMALIPRTGATRLAQVRGIGSAYPFYGTITTTPDDAFGRVRSGGVALVDPGLLIATNAHVGDTLALGGKTFVISGALKEVPGSSDIATALGPRIYVAQSDIASTGLLTFGSTAEYVALLKLPSTMNADAFAKPMRDRLDVQQVSIRTVTQSEQTATNAIGTLTQFISVVGLVALLLGGIGVASGVRTFVARKIDTVAILRCLGASSGQVMAIYVAQAAVMGLAGATLGAVLGIGVQYGLPHVIGQFLLVDVPVTIDGSAMLAGIAVGGWVAIIFSLDPLLALRAVSPLQTLRRETDAVALGGDRHRYDLARVLIGISLVASVVTVALVRASKPIQGVWMAGAAGAVIAVLVALATVVALGARKSIRQGWPYVIRQGIANVYRPGNQTRAVMLSLGFGAFLLATLYFVQHALLANLGGNANASRANMLFFDVQQEQLAPIDSIVRARGFRITQSDPVVQMRIAAINGRSALEIANDTVGKKPARWALRREYRSTFRDSTRGGEELTAGKWFSATQRSDTSEVSLEAGIAKDLHVRIGDIITWDIQGILVPTRIASLRSVKWTRFEPNFFAVFPPQTLRDAPKQYILLANVPGDTNIAAIQHAAALRTPNVSSLDLGIVTATLGKLVDKVDTAIRFMALFSFAMGIPVLFSAVSATRRDRIREGVLLKTLGASRAQVAAILLTEYALLGILGSATGVVLAAVATWALVRWVFSVPFVLSIAPALVIAGVMTVLTVTIGILAGRDVFKRPAMVALRE